MAFTTSKNPTGVLIVEVEGQLIVGNRQELKATIQQALDNGERKLLVDFAKTGYMTRRGWVRWSRFRRKSASRAGSCASAG